MLFPKFSAVGTFVLAGSVRALVHRPVHAGHGDNFDDYPEAKCHEPSRRQYLVEFAPDESKWVTRGEMLVMRDNGEGFMDITDYPNFGDHHQGHSPNTPIIFPHKVAHRETVMPMLSKLSEDRMRFDLELLTALKTRSALSERARAASDLMLRNVADVISETRAGRYGVSFQAFRNSWDQDSVIARIPGQTDRTIVVGAHLDSIHTHDPRSGAAPGADDDGSGTVTLLEVLRRLLVVEEIAAGNATNTLEFHWYSAEEIGLRGSSAVFVEYERTGRDVRAMLQQDMTGYSKGTLDGGIPDVMGVVTDFVDPGLTRFVKMVIDEYCTVGWVETQCGYACSDHASASKAGYPASFVLESAMENVNPWIHTEQDTVDRLDFEHMLQHARLVTGFMYELAFADFDEL